MTGVSCEITRETLGQDFAANIAFEAGRLEFRTGEPIVISLLVTNCTDSQRTRRYGDAQRYEFTVESVSSGYEEVWRWSDGRTFVEMLGEETFAPGETRVYREVWDQTDQAGKQVKPGLCDVSADDLRCEFDAPQTCASGTSIIIGIAD